jgi:hypothetical protein
VASNIYRIRYFNQTVSSFFAALVKYADWRGQWLVGASVPDDSILTHAWGGDLG